MKRLRDEAADPVVAALLDAAKTPPDPARKQRVRARLLATRRHRAGFLKPIVVGLLLVGGAAMASQLAVKIYERATRPPPKPASIAAPTTSPKTTATPIAPPAVEAPPAQQPKPVHRKRIAAVPTEEESALMMAALQALRREHDPVRAGVLLDDYLRRFENGALEEEALALAIEAAAARDDDRAADLAARYLLRHPQGRFRDAAERARARFAK